MRVGILKEIIQMAFDSLRTNKLRSFLTIIGIVIGVMTVIGMVSIIQGLNRAVLSVLESAGSDLIMIRKNDLVQMGRLSEEERQREDLTLEDAVAIERECSLVKDVAVRLIVDYYQEIPVKYRNIKSQDSIIFGMNEKCVQVFSIYLPEEGRFLTESDIAHRTKV